MGAKVGRMDKVYEGQRHADGPTETGPESGSGSMWASSIPESAER